MACPFSRNNGFGRCTGAAGNTARRSSRPATGCTNTNAKRALAVSARSAAAARAQAAGETEERTLCCRCPNCGNRFSARPGAQSAACQNSNAAQFYGGAAQEPAVYVPCCDERCGCRMFNVADRDPYWPAFAHPRWLSCTQLYACSQCNRNR